MKKVIEFLNEMKQIGLIKDYAIGGAIATLRWTEPFFTRDLDVFIILPQKVSKTKLIILTPIYEYLKNKGASWEQQWILVEDIPVDFIVADEFEEEAINNAQKMKIEDIETKVITPEYLIVLFLKAGREKDILKIELLLNQTKIDILKLKRLLYKFKLLEKFKTRFKKFR